MTPSNLFRCLALTSATLLVTAGCSRSNTATPAQTPPAANTQNQSPASITSSANEAPESQHAWTDEQILTCTVSQCWHLANKNEDNFFDIVQQLAAISAKNRDITLPESAEAGRKAGEIIKAKAKADHEQLLYAVVDDAVRRVGQPAAAPAK